jgi:hypothetical protein
VLGFATEADDPSGVQLYIAISARAIIPSSLHLAGFYLVECADLAEAVDIAAGSGRRNQFRRGARGARRLADAPE